jgi:lipoprotein NlpD
MGATSPGSDNAGKPGYYSVRSGDTLTRNCRSIMAKPGETSPSGMAWTIPMSLKLIKFCASYRLSVRPPPIDPRQVPSHLPRHLKLPILRLRLRLRRFASPSPASSAANTVNAANSDDNLVFAWPHPGQVLTGFDELKNKGLDFAGKAGDPVLAAADGKVVYAGSGLRGYGNLVILKHNNTYLTAYAHNQSLLVKEDQTVQKVSALLRWATPMPTASNFILKFASRASLLILPNYCPRVHEQTERHHTRRTDTRNYLRPF